MKSKIILIISVVVFGLVCSCGQINNSNQHYSGNNTEEVVSNDKGFDFAFKFNSNGSLRLLYSTANKQEYYLFDDEHDYQGDVFYVFIVLETLKNIDKDQWNIKISNSMIEWGNAKNACIAKSITKYAPYLKSVFDIPNVGNIPPSLKECFLKLYYDHQQSKSFVVMKRYGYQAYRINNNYNVTFERYKKTAGDGWDDIPDGAMMVYTSRRI